MAFSPIKLQWSRRLFNVGRQLAFTVCDSAGLRFNGADVYSTSEGGALATNRRAFSTASMEPTFIQRRKGQAEGSHWHGGDGGFNGADVYSTSEGRLRGLSSCIQTLGFNGADVYSTSEGSRDSFALTKLFRFNGADVYSTSEGIDRMSMR